MVKNKSELIQKDAVISEYDYRVQELEDENALLNEDLKHMHADIAAIQNDWSAEAGELKNQLVDANNTI